MQWVVMLGAFLVLLTGCIQQPTQAVQEKVICPDGTAVENSIDCKPNLAGGLQLLSAAWNCSPTNKAEFCSDPPFDVVSCWGLKYSLALPSNYVQHHTKRGLGIINSETGKAQAICSLFVNGKNVDYTQEPLGEGPVIEIQENTGNVLLDEGTSKLKNWFGKNLPFKRENKLDLCCFSVVNYYELQRENISPTIENAETCDSFVLAPFC